MPHIAISPITVPAAQSATDQAFQALYDAVISLQLPPGSKVSEAEIAKQLDVSRQPVRDAFFRLSQLGFLLIRPQRATLITPISEGAVLDAMFVRIALEVECLRILAKSMTKSCLQELHDHLAAQEAAIHAGDVLKFHALDEGFHETICRLSGHSHAWRLIQEQKAHMDRVRYLTLSEARQKEVLQEHQVVVDALEARDIPLSEQRLREHLSGIEAILSDIRKKYPDYFEDNK